jgi:CheY-like chemotaxis protein
VSPLPASKSTEPIGSGAVLIVEDDDDIRDSLAVVLEDEGLQVYTATNGQEGLDVLRRVARPDLILLDLMMPVMNGWEFLAELKRDTLFTAIPVIVVSAVSDKTPRPDGAVAFISKPVPLDQLLRYVRTHCRPAAKPG